MKTITIHVPDWVYAEFRRAARATGRPAAALIREAMEAYRLARLTPRHGLQDFQPVSVGRALRPLRLEDDLLEAMLDSPDGESCASGSSCGCRRSAQQ